VYARPAQIAMFKPGKIRRIGLAVSPWRFGKRIAADSHRTYKKDVKATQQHQGKTVFRLKFLRGYNSPLEGEPACHMWASASQIGKAVRDDVLIAESLGNETGSVLSE
jgi:hypothetical protein